MRREGALLSIFTLACGGAAELPPTEGCVSTADCDVGEVCDRPAGACIAEPADRIMGAISCRLFASRPSADEIRESGGGASDVVGALGSTRLAFLASTFCALHPNGIEVGSIESQVFMGRITYLLSMLIVGGQQARTGEPVALRTETTVPAVIYVQDPLSGENARAGVATSGIVIFDTVPRVGETLSIYIDLELQEE